MKELWFPVVYLLPLIPTYIVHEIIKGKSYSNYSLLNEGIKVSGPAATYFIGLGIALSSWSNFVVQDQPFTVRVVLPDELQRLVVRHEEVIFELQYRNEKPLIPDVERGPGNNNITLTYALPPRLRGEELELSLISSPIPVESKIFKIRATGEFLKIPFQGRPAGIDATPKSPEAVVSGLPVATMSKSADAASASWEKLAGNELLKSDGYNKLAAKDKVKLLKDKYLTGSINNQIIMLEEALRIDPFDELSTLWLAEKYLANQNSQRVIELTDKVSSLSNRTFPGWEHVIRIELHVRENDDKDFMAASANLKHELEKQKSQGYGYYYWKDNAEGLQRKIHLLLSDANDTVIRSNLEKLEAYLVEYKKLARSLR